MIALLLAFIALQVNPGPTGVAAGTVLSSSGAPAAGIRVFAIPAGNSESVSVNATVFDGLTQTDAMGHYRLTIPPGRYYIGAGSVSSPTYYPNTTNISSAKPIVVSANSTLDNINFSQYVTPSQSQTNFGNLIVSLNGVINSPLPPGSTGVLSGIIRTPDGAPAAGVPVVLVPSSVLLSTAAGTSPPQVRFQVPNPSANNFVILASSVTGVLNGVYTENDGRYRFNYVSPDAYYILAGYSDAPRFYPGTSNFRGGAPITTTPTTMLDTLDFTLSASPKSAVLQGKVLGIAGRPAGGAVVRVTGNNAIATGIGSLLPSQFNKEIRNEGNGSYRFDGISAGSYTIRVELPGFPSQTRVVQVSGQTNEDFDFQINTILGKILWDDGAPFNEPLINQVAVSTVSNPNVIMTDLIPVARDGVFSKVISAGEYRFYLRNLPSDEAVASVTAGGTDITHSSFAFNGKDALDIEVRLTRNVPTGTRVAGSILDASTGKAPTTDRALLCCLQSGPVEKFSTPLQPDGSFEFLHVPAGQYKVELQSSPPLTIAGSAIDVGASEIQNLRLLSSASMTPIMIQVTTGGGVVLPRTFRVKVTLTTQNSGIPITTDASPDGSLWYLPSNTPFDLIVSDIPQDMKIKSITAGGQTLSLSNPSVRTAVSAPITIIISLEKL